MEKKNKTSITELGNPAKPVGAAGEEMLSGMNERHAPVTEWAVGHFEFSGNERVLDIGCGGGAALKRLSAFVPDGHLTGIDYSPLSVELSRRNNAELIDSGKMEIIQASADDMPFEDESFDRIITVESFYFWKDHGACLKEVYRVLAGGGRFLITADIHGGAELTEEELEGVRKFELFNPTPDEFRQLLENAGFTDVKIHTIPGKNWICAEGNK